MVEDLKKVNQKSTHWIIRKGHLSEAEEIIRLIRPS